MKKKLLSLVLAGAMVASTSVSAFAATPGIVDGPDNKDATTKVEIVGNVTDETGEAKPGTFNVKVPTNASFSVNQDGEFNGTTIKVENKGNQAIQVIAHSFQDFTVDSSITVKGVGDVQSTNKRNVISLNLQGDEGHAFFSSKPGNSNGIYSDVNTVTGEEDIKLTTIQPQNEYELRLQGTAGTGATEVGEGDGAVTDNFTLVLKIKKA